MATTYREGGIVEVDPEPVVLPGDLLKEEPQPAASSVAPAEEPAPKKTARVKKATKGKK